MARRRGLSCNDVVACLDVLSDVDSDMRSILKIVCDGMKAIPSPKKCQIPTVK